MGNYKLYQGDCLEVMKDIEDGSVNLVVTDPPYLQNHTSGSPTSSAKQEKWQGNLKAGDKTSNIINKIKFREWVPEIYRILRPNSHCYIFVNDKNVQEVLNICMESGFKLHNILVWKKNNCTPNRWYMKNCEFIIFLHKGKSFPINNLESSQFLEYKNISGKNKLHPTQKPIELLEELILNSSKEDNIVFDPFMGSGSTGVACLNTNRDFIGIELDEGYFNITQNRIEEAANKTK